MNHAELDERPIWGAHSFVEGQLREWRIGELTLRCKWAGDDLWVFHELNRAEWPEPAPGDEDERPGTKWMRWPLAGARHAVTLAPRMPDRPLVVRVENPFQLLPSAKARIFVRTPIWAALYAGKARHEPLVESPCARLSNTWFGSFTEGELCYWLSSGARHSVEPDPRRPYMAICPISLRNRDSRPLTVERICVRVAGLALYQTSDGQIWSDETFIFYHGPQNTSRLRVRQSAPPEAPGAPRIADARAPQFSGLRAKTFAALRELSSLGSAGEE